MLNKLVKYIPFAMALIIGLIANRIISILQIFTNNAVMSNVVGFAFGLGMLFLWKLIYYKLETKKDESKLDQFK